ncbi:MAG: hypothetical protein QM530_01925 [Phycisphaerales bacterium]|nr:hypothetical protein [Phycisphaerales bacterium]
MNCSSKLLFFVFCLGVFHASSAQWHAKQIQDGLSNCYASFLSAKTDYILSISGLQYTNDSGKSWRWLSLLKENNLFDVFFVNDSVGWVAGGNYPKGIVHKTRDGGTNWTTNKTALK